LRELPSHIISVDLLEIDIEGGEYDVYSALKLYLGASGLS
jgi:hypothetical protein